MAWSWVIHLYCALKTELGHQGPGGRVGGYHIRISLCRGHTRVALIGMDGEQLGPEREEFIHSISDDVMLYLTSSGFFAALDDRLCPADDHAPRELRDHTDKISESILGASGFPSDDLADIFDVVMSKSCHSDCGILCNAVEESRLKAGYWKERAGAR